MNQSINESQPLLDIRGLRKQYGPVEVLKGVDLSMQRGNVVTLIGSSGSGKTTLLRCVNLLEEFQGGQITLDGESIGYNEVNGKRVRHPEKIISQHRAMTGMAFQQFNLFPHLTALQNVTLGLLKVKKMGKDEAAAFTPRAPWETECSRFHAWMEIPFFTRYQSWTSSDSWKRVIQSEKISSCKAVLTQNLFMLNDTFQPSLLRVRKLCVEISQLKLHQIKKGSTYTLTKFH